jgi:hypothetical protein
MEDPYLVLSDIRNAHGNDPVTIHDVRGRVLLTLFDGAKGASI